MSTRSVRDKVKRGLTGPHCPLPVCLPTSIEHLTPRRVRDETYLAFIGAHTIDETDGIHKRVKNQFMTVAYSMIANDIGLNSVDEFLFANCDSLREFKKTVAQFIRLGHGIILDIDAPYDEIRDDTPVLYDPTADTHAVGLRPIIEDGTHFRVCSSWVPKVLQGIVCVDELYDHLVHQRCPEWKLFAFHDANVTAFPRKAPNR